MQSKAALHNIDTLRYLATFLLVAYHVIGIDTRSGMQMEYPSGWRMFADAMIDVRMPFFAFIAGAVYAVKPLALDAIPQFFKGKFRRLVIPGVIAAVLFWFACNYILKSGFAYGEDILWAVFLSSGHFWFLQSILLIFVIVGLLDALLRYRAALALFIASILLTLVWRSLGVPRIEYLELTNTVYLTPYFIVGLLAVRRDAVITAKKNWVIVGSIALVIYGISANIVTFQGTDTLSKERFDIQSLSTGMGLIFLSSLLLPRVTALKKLAVYSFTIYLYHPIGTSAVRRIVESTDISISHTAHFVLGVVAGILIPVGIHMLATQSSLIQRTLLGLKSSKL